MDRRDSLNWWKSTLRHCCHYLVVLGFVLSSAAFADDLLKKAEQLISSGQHQQAYDLLLAEAEERSGTPDFDLLLGIAALDSGHPSHAVFALERVLAMQPNNAHARAELAKAYFQMGENEAAKEEFTAVNKQQVICKGCRRQDKTEHRQITTTVAQ